jgi:hypothetical protein
VACSRALDAKSKDASVVFPAVRNVDYLVMVGRLGEGSGKVRLSYRGAEEFVGLVRPWSVELGYLQVQMFVAPGKYEWSWGNDVSVWTPMFQTNVPSGLFQHSELLRLDTPSRVFRLTPAK